MSKHTLKADLDVVLGENYVWVDQEGNRHNERFSHSFNFINIHSLQNKIDNYINNGELLILKQEYDNIDEESLPKNELLDFSDSIDLNKNVNRLDSENFSFKLSIIE